MISIVIATGIPSNPKLVYVMGADSSIAIVKKKTQNVSYEMVDVASQNMNTRIKKIKILKSLTVLNSFKKNVLFIGLVPVAYMILPVKGQSALN